MIQLTSSWSWRYQVKIGLSFNSRISALVSVLSLSRFQWEAAVARALTNPLFLVGLLVFSIITALFCGVVMHAIVRIFRWIRCSLTGGSCEEYAPATWLKAIVTGGCSIYGLVTGPLTSFAAEAGLVNLLRR